MPISEVRTFRQELATFLTETGVTVQQIAASTLTLEVEIHELLQGRKLPSTSDLKRLFDVYEVRAAPRWRGRLFSAYLGERYPRSWLEATAGAMNSRGKEQPAESSHWAAFGDQPNGDS